MPQEDKSQEKEKISEKIVKELSPLIRNTGRHTTCDNYFSSISLFDEMLQLQTTMLGTLRKNKTEVPSVMLQKQEKDTSTFAYDDTKVMIGYAPQNNKKVLLLSTVNARYNDKVDTNKNLQLYWTTIPQKELQIRWISYALTTPLPERRIAGRFVFGLVCAKDTPIQR